MNETSTGRGSGKFIIFGEHAVVYGRPALASSLSRGAMASLRRVESPRWTAAHPAGAIDADDQVARAVKALLATFDLHPEQLEIDVELTIPVGAGLGSSAAMAVALARAAAGLCGFDGEQAKTMVNRAVAASEAVFHGNASGIDQRAASGAGFFRFQRQGESPTFESFEVPAQRWIVAQVAPSQSTAEMVAAVASLYERRHQLVDRIFDDIAVITESGRQALCAGRWDEVGELMNLNQGLLNALGVSSPRLEAACQAARDAGAFGAKLTGAGGGGCIIALGGPGDAVESSLTEFGPVYTFDLPSKS